MKNKISSIFIAILSTGCATKYEAPKGAPLATVSLSAKIEASGTTGQGIYLFIWQDETCRNNENGINGGSSSGFASTPELNTQQTFIAAGKPFYFTARYFDARLGQNRMCLLTGFFKPEAEHSYRILMDIQDDVRACNLGVVDKTNNQEERVDFSMPTYACYAGTQSNILNGQPQWGTMRFKVVPSYK